MKDRLNLLVKLLFDQGASVTEKDDAATYLSEFSDNQAVDALLSKGKDRAENQIILNSCGESLGIIWIKKNVFDESAYRSLSSTARYGVYVVIKSRKPEWIEKFKLENDDFLD
jgi:hypothetical protein